MKAEFHDVASLGPQIWGLCQETAFLDITRPVRETPLTPSGELIVRLSRKQEIRSTTRLDNRRVATSRRKPRGPYRKGRGDADKTPAPVHGL